MSCSGASPFSCHCASSQLLIGSAWHRGRVQLTSQSWFRLAEDDALWHRFHDRELGGPPIQIKVRTGCQALIAAGLMRSMQRGKAVKRMSWRQSYCHQMREQLEADAEHKRTINARVANHKVSVQEEDREYHMRLTIMEKVLSNGINNINRVHRLRIASVPLQRG